MSQSGVKGILRRRDARCSLFVQLHPGWVRKGQRGLDEDVGACLRPHDRAGRQPTTLHVGNGDHVRGFAAPSMTRLLEHDLGFRIERVVGVGLAPVTGAALPRPLRGLSHTIVWVARKPGAAIQDPVPAVPVATGP